ncbi:helix-turn-helix domain-containing protein [Donghicola mangrovi]|uniref:Helix-turn-helix domain-containing protein n=1 Tax=Donghicola mangrovi TaxID=2729614 RepID=A0A850QHY0_9RHOB|nr:XRE family transcriptional regulator [Donghicola mangrovi]NVO25639.1 helix-turn-helix domain-containing protein [Donghicola mangrovi]
MEDDLDTRIGARIRAEREIRNWSLTDLAERASVSRAMIHKVERGSSSPTANLLAKLASAFGLSMSTLMARAEVDRGRLVRQSDQPVWTDPETGYLRKQVSLHSDLPFDLVEVTLPPHTAVPMPGSSYAFVRQLIWVQEGTLTFVEGAAEHIMEAGDYLELGPPINTIFRNDTDLPTRYAFMVLRTV